MKSQFPANRISRMPFGAELLFHLATIFVVIAWGLSFVNTRVLLDYGLTPSVIYVYRFSLAYVSLLAVSRFKISMFPLRDELLAMACGLTGGTIYFIAENTALDLTLVTNVAFIVNTVPLFTAIVIVLACRDERFTPPMIIGSVIALAGVALLVFQNGVEFDGSFLGSLLAFGAALSWALYSLLLKKLQSRYAVLALTRKIFFYGIVTSLVFIFFDGEEFKPKLLLVSPVLYNILFLGIVCSMACFFLWNKAVKELGAIRTSNYLYFSPIVSIAASMIILDEQINAYGIIGCFLILGGVIVSELRSSPDR